MYSYPSSDNLDWPLTVNYDLERWPWRCRSYYTRYTSWIPYLTLDRTHVQNVRSDNNTAQKIVLIKSIWSYLNILSFRDQFQIQHVHCIQILRKYLWISRSTLCRPGPFRENVMMSDIKAFYNRNTSWLPWPWTLTLRMSYYMRHVSWIPYPTLDWFHNFKINQHDLTRGPPLANKLNNFHSNAHCTDSSTYCIVVNGGWSSWINTPCTATCGNGVVKGTRTCTNPTPRNGGKTCSGASKATTSCKVKECPGKW